MRDDGGLDQDGSAGTEDKRKDSGYVLEAGWLLGDALRILLHVILQSLIAGIWEFSSAWIWDLLNASNRKYPNYKNFH